MRTLRYAFVLIALLMCNMTANAQSAKLMLNGKELAKNTIGSYGELKGLLFSVTTTDGSVAGSWEVTWTYDNIVDSDKTKTTFQPSDIKNTWANDVVHTLAVKCEYVTIGDDKKEQRQTVLEKTVNMVVYPEASFDLGHKPGYFYKNTGGETWIVSKSNGGSASWTYSWKLDDKNLNGATTNQCLLRNYMTADAVSEEKHTLSVETTISIPTDMEWIGSIPSFTNAHSFYIYPEPRVTVETGALEYYKTVDETWAVTENNRKDAIWHYEWKMDNGTPSGDKDCHVVLGESASTQTHKLSLSIRVSSPDGELGVYEAGMWTLTVYSALNVYEGFPTKNKFQHDFVGTTWRVNVIPNDYPGGVKYNWTLLKNGVKKEEKTTTTFSPSYTNDGDSKEELEVRCTVTAVGPNGREWDSKSVAQDNIVLYANPRLLKKVYVENEEVTGTLVEGFEGMQVRIEFTPTAYEAGSEWHYTWTNILDGTQDPGDKTEYEFMMPKAKTGTIGFSATCKLDDFEFKVDPQSVKWESVSYPEIKVHALDSLNLKFDSYVTVGVDTKGGYSKGWTINYYLLDEQGTVLNETVYNRPELAWNLTDIVGNSQTRPRSYKVKVTAENKLGPKKIDNLEHTSDMFTVWPECVFDTGMKMYDEGRGGVESTEFCIREGNTYRVELNQMTGGYTGSSTDGADYKAIWFRNDIYPEAAGFIRSGLKAQMIDMGNVMAVDNSLCLRGEMRNYGPSNTVWQSAPVSQFINIYRKPATPRSLTIMGNGSTGTVVATMSNVEDQDLVDRKYSLVFGYETKGSDGVYADNAASRQTVEQSKGTTRWCNFAPSLLQDTNNRFYVYALWVYPDGSRVTSDKRYMNGGEVFWDGSVFANETRIEGDVNGVCAPAAIEDEGGPARYYSISGQVLGRSRASQPGIVIKETMVGTQRVRTKCVIK